MQISCCGTRGCKSAGHRLAKPRSQRIFPGTENGPHHKLLVEGLLGKVRTVWQLRGSVSVSCPPAAAAPPLGSRLLGAAGWEAACATDATVAPRCEQGLDIVQYAPAAGNSCWEQHKIALLQSAE